jgi:ubiquinone/menaquinone biosynthesis C-methylase UbiE
VTSSADPVAATVRVYNSGATAFTEASRDRGHMSYLHESFASLCPGRRVLDIGAGPGHDAAVFAGLGFDVIGADPSLALLAAARKHAPLAGRLICSDSRGLALSDGSFDGVWACASLLHLPKYHAPHALQEAFRVLSHAGLLFTSMQEGKSDALVETGAGDSLPGRFYSFYRAEEWLELVEGAGFELIEQRLKRTREHVTPGATGWIETYARKPATSSSR